MQLRMHLLFNLRRDPYERSQKTSNTFYDWQLDHAFMFVPAQAYVAQFLETFRDAMTFALEPENRIDGVLIAGNLFHRHRPEPETWAFVRGLFGRLVAHTYLLH